MTLLSSRSGGRAAVYGGAALLLLVAADAVAQPAPRPRPRSEVPPVITTGDDGVVRTSGGQPGVLDVGDDKKGFDPTKADAPADGDAKPGTPEDDATKVEDVIEWKTNFEQGIKCRKIPLNAKIRLDFNEISLGDLTKFISCVTEQNFILTGGANKNATVSILSPKPVTAYEAYKAYLSALEANGLSIVPNGRFLEIVPAGETKANGGPIYGVGRTGPNTDQMVTRLLQLDHVQAEEILPVLEKFKTGAADITVYAPTNTIILTDTGSNIRRLLKLIKELDVPVGKERIWIRPIVNTTAADLVQLLTQIIGSGSGGSSASSTPARRTTSRRASRNRPTAKTPTQASSSVVQGSDELANISVTKMIADERTNSVIFVATRTAYLQVDKVIRRLDVPIPGEGSYHVQQLENADAEEVAQTLSSLASGSASSRTSSRVGRPRTATAAGGTAASTSGAAGLFEGEVKITAYKPTNSLLIESSLKDYLQIQKILRELDVRRKQVYVEAIVMEIATSKDKSVNLNASGGDLLDIGGEQLPLLFASGGLGLDINGALSTLNSGGGAVGLQGPIESVSTGSDAGAGSFSLALFGFTLRALQTTSDVNVLSTPHVLTLENEDAEITIGKRQPYVTTSTGLGSLGSLSSLSSLAGGLTGGSTTGLSSLTSGLGGLTGLSGLGRNFQYVDVDLTLKIKPQVNASGYVRLEIDESIDDITGFVGGSASDGGAPITSKRKVNNVVVVRDGQPVVIGGLMRDKETESVQKIPFLGDIPLIGLLFRQTSTQIEKSNLLMIIIPHVISDPSDLKQIYEQRREEYRELARAMAERKKEFEGELDYRKKAGVLHDIHEVIQKAKSERELRERAVFEGSEVDRVGPPETHDIEYDPRDAFKKAPEGGK